MSALDIGLAACRAGRLDEAEACFARAVADQPGSADALSLLGAVVVARGRPAEAARLLERAVTLAPSHLGAWQNLAVACGRLDRDDDAVACWRRVVGLAPADPAAHRGLGLALGRGQRWAEALAALGRAAELAPQDAELAFNVGVALQETGQVEAALRWVERAVGLAPSRADLLNGLGLAWMRAGRAEPAIAAFDRALALAPDEPEFQYNRAAALLKAGRYRDGWAVYHWRWQAMAAHVPRRHAGIPALTALAAARGRSVLLWSEQGFGDMLQFVRYAALLAPLAGAVVLEVQPSLVRLFRSLPGIASVHAVGEPLPSCDLQAPMLDLPALAGTDLATVPAAIPYLAADTAAVDRWRRRLGQGRRVGLAWAGGASPGVGRADRYDQRRSIDPRLLQPLLGVAGVQFVSLQIGASASGTPPGVVDLSPELGDFAETAAVIAACDLVIAVDTAVVHLAGALGRPVWLLNRFDSCWRWLEQREDSPWYPTLRQFRQVAPGDWPEVIGRVRDALADWASAP